MTSSFHFIHNHIANAFLNHKSRFRFTSSLMANYYLLRLIRRSKIYYRKHKTCSSRFISYGCRIRMGVIDLWSFFYGAFSFLLFVIAILLIDNNHRRSHKFHDFHKLGMGKGINIFHLKDQKKSELVTRKSIPSKLFILIHSNKTNELFFLWSRKSFLKSL